MANHKFLVYVVFYNVCKRVIFFLKLGDFPLQEKTKHVSKDVKKKHTKKKKVV